MSVSAPAPKSSSPTPIAALPAVPVDAKATAPTDGEVDIAEVGTQAAAATLIGAAGTYGGLNAGMTLGMNFGINAVGGPALLKATVGILVGLQYGLIGAAVGGAVLGTAGIFLGVWAGKKAYQAIKGDDVAKAA